MLGSKLLANYNFTESEKKWQDFWQTSQVYRWQKEEPRISSFVIDTPPPTVSGQLHIGHVYSYTQTDFIARFHRMIGKNIFYPIGFDDNGLPTERLVEKTRNIKAGQVDRKQFIKICKEVVVTEEEKFRSLFNKIALSVDWQLEYQTINPTCTKLSQMSFLDLIQKGEVYRASQPVLWDPIDQTALAQADIEDKEKKSYLNDIIFSTENGEQFIVATTRPEMLPACVAVFYHPSDSRYQHLQGKYAVTPLFKDKVPILADEIVEPSKGSGIVMCCTFGDQTDIIWWKTHKLPTKIILNKQGVICDPQGKIDGLKINEARNKIIELLKVENLLNNQTEITHTVKCAERSGAPLEILTAQQWFIRTITHKESLLQKIEEVNWHPKHMKIRLENWINSIAWDWCISRQRYFGVPFPVWYSKRNGEEGKILFADINQLPVDPLVDLPSGYTREEVEAEIDVMDTWATSSISPQLCSHAISERFAIDLNRHQQLFPADLRPQAHEILRTWAFYTILKSHLHQNTVPWHNIMISGWCVAEDRSKMSKSKGNIIDPTELLEQYGADVIRYWASTARLGADIAYCKDTMQNGKRLVNKIWNAAKFVSIHFDMLQQQDKQALTDAAIEKISHELDQWLISKLANLTEQTTALMLNYEYADARQLIEQFFWSVFCDNYIEFTKTRAYDENKEDANGQYSAVLTLYHALQALLKLFAPFLPHITEEIYQNIYSNESIHRRGNWSNFSGISLNVNHEACDGVIEVVNLIRKAKASKNLSVKAPIQMIEIKGLLLSKELTKDLQNVTAAAQILCVTELTKDRLTLTSGNIEITWQPA